MKPSQCRIVRYVSGSHENSRHDQLVHPAMVTNVPNDATPAYVDLFIFFADGRPEARFSVPHVNEVHDINKPHGGYWEWPVRMKED